jgi:hypothetical protein
VHKCVRIRQCQGNSKEKNEMERNGSEGEGRGGGGVCLNGMTADTDCGTDY